MHISTTQFILPLCRIARDRNTKSLAKHLIVQAGIYEYRHLSINR